MVPALHPIRRFKRVASNDALGAMGCRFRPPNLNGGSRFRKETIAGMRGNGQDAPTTDLPGAAANGWHAVEPASHPAAINITAAV
jgi:hypothetical protein